jgi:hyperosmotically inducible protein
VETRHGVVILKGKLANQAAVDHVKLMAQNVDGVKSVDASGLKVGAQ